MMIIARRELIYFWYYFTVQLEQVFRYWAIGIVVGSIISVFFKERINLLFGRMNGSRWGVAGILPASLLGIASPLCMYGTIPIAASLGNQGMREDYLGAFMMSSVLLNPQLFFYSLMLGNKAAALRLLFCTFGGVFAGLLIYIFFEGKQFFSFGKFHIPESHDTDPNAVMRLLKNIGRNIKITGPYFLIGIILSALYQRYIPPEWVAGLFGSSHGFGILLAATIGIPLYVCGGGTIPLLQQWLASGMSMGSAVSFMITGPATKITNLGALKIVMNKKSFLLYILFVVTFALLSGFLVNMV